MALFSSTSDARTFENQAARKKGVLKLKTIRMDTQEDPAFPIPMWKTTLEMIKDSATARIGELKNQHCGDEDALAKILF